jgi:hypothetical protein
MIDMAVRFFRRLLHIPSKEARDAKLAYDEPECWELPHEISTFELRAFFQSSVLLPICLVASTTGLKNKALFAYLRVNH